MTLRRDVCFTPESVAQNGGTMPDLVAGKQYHAEVMIAKQDYSNIPGMIEAGTEGTAGCLGPVQLQQRDADGARQRY